VNYGYEDSRHGEVYMTDGTYLNIRTFNYPYGDYRGSFADNPFLLQAVQREAEKPEGIFMEEAERSFSEIAKEGQGDFLYAADPSDLVKKLNEIFIKETGKNVDIVLCLDATGSMGPYINELRKMLIPMIREIISGYSSFRIGMVLYRDYKDEFLNKVIPFTSDFYVFQRNLNAVWPKGGGDIPEAVYEALYEGADKFPWAAESRLLILVGDAPPHPRQRGIISKEMVYEKVAEKKLKLSAILLPQ
jgi:Mg-chelatase subunit ChlD